MEPVKSIHDAVVVLGPHDQICGVLVWDTGGLRCGDILTGESRHASERFAGHGGSKSGGKTRWRSRVEAPLCRLPNGSIQVPEADGLGADDSECRSLRAGGLRPPDGGVHPSSDSRSC